MDKRRKGTPVIFTHAQRKRLERLQLVYYGYGPKTTPGNEVADIVKAAEIFSE